MSGGFFRGTSADQDTRFSNKQAKLLKSQKFAPELENLVEMAKVQMDVMKPWIAHRVTELLGFEDEVLINFIYGLLEGKEVNGKEIQIQLTGFMEKNTGRFMKELWSLLLSAQNNASGVPQQFLDAKEEETKKKMAEAERITSEIHKRKEEEMEEREVDRMKKMDVEKDLSRAKNGAAALDQVVKLEPSDSNARSANDKDTNDRNGSRGRSRLSRSPRSAERSLSSPRRRPSRSVSNSISNSRSRSNERRKSRSISKSSKKRSISPSPRNRPYYRRRSRSPSPLRRRLRSPIRRRSRSPIRRRSRSPIRYRSRTPIRRRSRSPVRAKSPSSPFGWQRSPVSPARRRYRRSPSTPRRRSGSPVRRRPSGGSGRRSPTPPRRGGSRSPQGSSSQSLPPRRTPPSPGRRSPKRTPPSPGRRSPKRQRSPIPSPRDRIRTLEKGSPLHRAPPRDNIERRLTPVSVQSPRIDLTIENGPRKKLPSLSPPRQRSPSLSESPPPRERGLASTHESPVKQRKGQVIHGISPSPPRKSRELKPIRESRVASMEDEERSPFRDEHQKMKSSDLRSIKPSVSRAQKDSLEYTDKYSPGSLISLRSVDTHRDYVDSRKKDKDTKSEKLSLPEPATTMKVTLSSEKVKEPYLGEDNKGKLGNKVDQNDHSSDESEKHRSGNNEKCKSRKSKRHEVTSDDDYSDDSQKDAKKQRKEEKRLKKEERRRKREERRRKKNERRSEKTKLKTAGYSSDEEQSVQKRLEIELREKALERLRAKKGSGK